MTKAYHLALWPRDGLFLKDGRGWYTSDVGRSHAHAWPYPHTVRGALRAAWGQAYMARTDEHLPPKDWERRSAPVRVRKLVTVRRPVTAASLQPEHRMWPVPADARQSDGRWHALMPSAEPGLEGIDIWPHDAEASHDSPDARAFAGLWRPVPPEKSVRIAADADADADAIAEKKVPRLDSEPSPSCDSNGLGDDSGLENELFERNGAFFAPIDADADADADADDADADADADAARFWSDAAFCHWLQTWPQCAPERPLGFSPAQRTDIHVTLDAATRTATPAMLFSCEVTETLESGAPGSRAAHEWGMALECELPDDTSLADALVLGGRRRMSRVESLSSASVQVFADPGPAFFDALAGSRGLRLVCVTPARFARGWLPDGFAAPSSGPHADHFLGRLPGVDAPVLLRAAVIPRPEHVSPWNTVTRRPRPTVSLVPAGAVYFFQKTGGQTFTADECRALWLAAWGHPPENGPGPSDGLGLVVPGRWQPEQQG